MTTPASKNDLTTLDDDELIGQRAALRTRLAELSWHDEQRTELENRYVELTDEFDRRARAAWRQATNALRDQDAGTTGEQP